jgi:hypothetical protein
VGQRAAIQSRRDIQHYPRVKDETIAFRFNLVGGRDSRRCVRNTGETRRAANCFTVCTPTIPFASDKYACCNSGPDAYTNPNTDANGNQYYPAATESVTGSYSSRANKNVYTKV